MAFESVFVSALFGTHLTVKFELVNGRMDDWI